MTMTELKEMKLNSFNKNIKTEEQAIEFVKEDAGKIETKVYEHGFLK